MFVACSGAAWPHARHTRPITRGVAAVSASERSSTLMDDNKKPPRSGDREASRRRRQGPYAGKPPRRIIMTEPITRVTNTIGMLARALRRTSHAADEIALDPLARGSD